MARKLYLRTVDVSAWVNAWPASVRAVADSAVPDAQFSLLSVAPATGALLVDSLPDGPLAQDDAWFVDDAGRPLPFDPLVEWFSGRVKTVKDTVSGDGTLGWAISCAGYHEDLNQIIDWLTFDTNTHTVGGITFDFTKDTDRVRWLVYAYLPGWDTSDQRIPATAFATYNAPTSYRQVPLLDILRDLASYGGLPSDPVYPAPGRAWRLGSTAAGGLGKYLQYYSRVNGATVSSVGVSTAEPLDADEVLGTDAERTQDTSALFNAVAIRGPGGDTTDVTWDADSLVNAEAHGATLEKTDGVDGAWDAGAISEGTITDEGGTVTATPLPPDGSESTLAWSSIGRVNVSVSGASLTKSGGTDGVFDAGAFGDPTQGISDLGGYAQTVLPAADRVLAFGLSHTDTDATDTSIGIGIRTNGAGGWAAIAAGVVLSPTFAFSAGDTIRVRIGATDTGLPIPVTVEQQTVGTTAWSPVWSTLRPAGSLTFPLYVDASLATVGDDWDSGARTSTHITATGGYATASLAANKRSGFALAPAGATLGYTLTDLEWGVYTLPGNVARVTHRGAEITRWTYTHGDKVRLTATKVGGADTLEVATQPSGGGAWTVRALWTLTAGPFVYPLALVGLFGSSTGVSITGRLKPSAAGSEADVVWDAGTTNHVTISGNAISKSGTTRPSLSGGKVLGTPPQVVEAAFGFSPTDADADWTSIAVGVQTLADGTLNVIQAGVVLADFTYTRGDRFRLDLRPDHTGTMQAEVSIVWADGSGTNSLYVWTPSGLTYPLYVDTSLATLGATLADVTLRRHSYSRFQRDDSVGAPWNFGPIWANAVVEDDSLDTVAKRQARADALFDAHAYPRIGYQVTTEGRQPSGVRWQFDPGMLVPFRDPDRTWDPAVNLPLAAVTTDWSTAIDEAWPVQTLEAGDRFPEQGEAAPYLLRTPGLDTPVPTTPTGLARREWGQDGVGTAWVRMGWDRTTHTERWILLRVWRRIGSNRWILHTTARFDAGRTDGVVGGLIPSLYRVEIAAEDNRGRTSPFSTPGVSVEIPALVPDPVATLTVLAAHRIGGTDTGWVRLAWTLATDNTPDGVAGYDLEATPAGRGSLQPPPITVATRDPAARQGVISGLSIGMPYTIKVWVVSAWNTRSATAPSQSVRISTPGWVPPAPDGTRTPGTDAPVGWALGGDAASSIRAGTLPDAPAPAFAVPLSATEPTGTLTTDPPIYAVPGARLTVRLGQQADALADVTASAAIQALDADGAVLSTTTLFTAQPALLTITRTTSTYTVPTDASYLVLVLTSSGATADVTHYWTVETWDTATATATGLRYALVVPLLSDAAGTDLATGVYPGDWTVPAASVLVGWTLLAPTSSTITLDVLTTDYSGYDTFASIVGSTAPALSAQIKNSDTTLTGWTTSLAQDDIIRVNVDSVSGCEAVSLALLLERV